MPRLIITTTPHSISGTRMSSCKANTKKEFSRQWVFQTSAKWNWSYQRYLDPDYKGSEGKTENSYYQQRVLPLGFGALPGAQQPLFSLSTDASINRLNANLKDFAYPTRYSWLTAFAGKYVNDWLTASASVLATVINEEVRQGSAAANRRKLSVRQRVVQALCRRRVPHPPVL